MMKFDLLKTIRNLLRGKKMSFEFKEVDVEDIENEISLKSKGEVDGKNNLPSENSEVFSITENEAITKFEINDIVPYQMLQDI